MTEQVNQAPQLHVLLQKGLEVLDKITGQAVALNKQEMIDYLNFETAVRHVIKVETEAISSPQPPPGN